MLRFLKPGFALNVLFTKWDDPAFQALTGQLVKGTTASDVQTGLRARQYRLGTALVEKNASLGGTWVA